LNAINKLLRWIFYAVIVRFVVLVVLGLNVRHRERLPQQGPAILVGNHNSHLDTLVLFSLLPIKQLPQVRAAAAADYFLRNRALAWFATEIVGIVPVTRKISAHNDPLAGCSAALERGDILIFFPEGSRGEPERMGQFKRGIAHLVKRHPGVPVIPVYLHGLGKALPKGEGLLVPFFCDVFVGEALRLEAGEGCMDALNAAMQALADEGGFSPWD
jgi:1-acyl-sn-glycerol-3-phosphate acyltransferase